MKSIASASLLALSSGAAVFAGPAEQAIIAAMRLSERPNYSWRATLEHDANAITMEGKTDVHGLTWVRLPAPGATARRLGSDSESSFEVFLGGNRARVVLIGDRWRPVTELSLAPEPAPDLRNVPIVRGSASVGGAFGRRSTKPAPASVPGWPFAAAHGESLPTVTLPHEELAIIVSGATSLEATAGVATGTLSETGAALLLARHDEISPLSASGEFKLWLHGGHVVKYQVNLQGLLLINRRKIPANVRSTTVLMDIGTTRFTVPDEVRSRLAP